jgi:C1A family cysteine protease
MIIGVAMLTTVMSTLNVFADVETVDNDSCRLGCIPETQEELEAFFGEPKTATTRSALPSSVDLSQTNYFPPIGNQGSLNSCTSFATAYYQFSYEVNRLNNISSTNEQIVYSPKWIYNLVNEGGNYGSRITYNYLALENLGCLKNSDFPYTGNIDDYKEVPSEMEMEKIEALSTRVVEYDMYSIPNDANISSPNSTALNGIKNLLNQGKVLTSSTRCYFNSMNVDGECIAYRCTKNSFANGHAITIVGYDDNKFCDVNGNGNIEDCEKGAFKVANSWGKVYNSYGLFSEDNEKTGGFFWVLYDSLNSVSANTVNNWESNLSGTRYPTFSSNTMDDDYNYFFSIEVAHKNVNLVGEIDINTLDKECFELMINRSSDSVKRWSDTDCKRISPYNGIGLFDESIPFDGLILFDYDYFATPISMYRTGYNWHVKLGGTTVDETQASFRVLDNKGTAITDFKNLTRYGNGIAAYQNISLAKGDVDYDGEVTVMDSNIIMNYVAMVTTLSNLQYDLADYNNDGHVNVSDVVSINMNLSSTVSPNELIELNQLNKRIQEYMSTDFRGDLNEIN